MPAFHGAPVHDANAVARDASGSPADETGAVNRDAAVSRARAGWPEPAFSFRTAHRPYSAFLAATSLSCVAYAVQVDGDPAGTARSPQHAPTARPCGDAPDAFQPLFRKTAP